MNDEIAKQVVSWMQSLGNAVAEQAPGVAHEIVLWWMINASIWCAFAIPFWVGAYFILREARSLYRSGEMDAGSTGFFCAAFVSLIALLITSGNLHNFALAYFAPKVAVLKTIGALR